MSNGPPWQLSDCSVYRYFLCPENICDFKTFTEDEFKDHMNSNHSVLVFKEEDDIFSLQNTKVIDVSQLDQVINGFQIPRNSFSAKIIPFKKKSKISGVTFDCRSCGFLFDTIKELREHIDFEHSEPNVPNDNHDSLEINGVSNHDDNDILTENEDDHHFSDEDYVPSNQRCKDLKNSFCDLSNLKVPLFK